MLARVLFGRWIGLEGRVGSSGIACEVENTESACGQGVCEEGETGD